MSNSLYFVPKNRVAEVRKKKAENANGNSDLKSIETIMHTLIQLRMTNESPKFISLIEDARESIQNLLDYVYIGH